MATSSAPQLLQPSSVVLPMLESSNMQMARLVGLIGATKATEADEAAAAAEAAEATEAIKATEAAEAAVATEAAESGKAAEAFEAARLAEATVAVEARQASARRSAPPMRSVRRGRPSPGAGRSNAPPTPQQALAPGPATVLSAAAWLVAARLAVVLGCDDGLLQVSMGLGPMSRGGGNSKRRPPAFRSLGGGSSMH